MISNTKNIKKKIDELDSEIEKLEIKINEMSWKRTKYKQFYEKQILEINNVKD
tara:strand:+ start:77 stop:235 length:159 start_codon:yes stop_codon:yes gene_type:complete